ncbi:MAG TPA: ATP-binding protein [Vicinamibacterales bacterium]|jgi:signal transduction histidine kinase
MAPAMTIPGRKRRGIQTRVVLLVGIGILAALAIFGGTSFVGFNSLTERLAAEREMLARSIAAHLDYVVRSELEILQGVSGTPGVDLSDRDPSPEQSALRTAYLRSRLFERVFLIGRDGAVLLDEPSRPAGGGAPTPPQGDVGVALQTGRPVISDLTEAGGRRRLYLLVPMRNWRGQVVALAGGEVDPEASRFVTILEPYRLGRTGITSLVDSTGTVIAATDASRRFRPSAHPERLGAKIRSREPVVEVDAEGDARTVVAIAPLLSAPWAVVMLQDEAETFAQGRSMARRVLWLGPALLGLALLFALGAARSVKRPLALLTASAERIASGDLDQPIPRLAEDEVGRLGGSLERMRVALRTSMDTIARANQELEQRVESRTHELQGLYRQLQEREQWREELLRKVISAQEDERKRLARELHDETSQTLSALAMKIETALAAWPQEASRDRLVEAKALTVRTLDELHRLIFDLRPSVLDDLGLLSAIRWYAERHLESRGITVRCEFSGIETRLLPELETALFRVAQEAITNIAKHSGAETVLIQCFEHDDRISIEIEDDGKGFAPEDLPPPAARERGLGLLGMRERIELFGGTIEIDSAPGRGTRIAVAVPTIQEVGHAQDSRPNRG